MTTIFTNALGTDRADTQGSFRDVLTITGGAQSQVRVTFTAASGTGLAYSNCSIGIWSGTTMITTATPVPLLFGGNPGCSAAAGASTPASDWANLTGFTSSDKLVVVTDFVSTSHSTDQSGTAGATLYFLFGAFASYNSADPTALGSWGNVPWVVAVSSIETQAVGGSPLKINSNLDGLSSSGGFFRNPLARSQLGWRPSIVTARRKLILPRHIERRAA